MRRISNREVISVIAAGCFFFFCVCSFFVNYYEITFYKYGWPMAYGSGRSPLFVGAWMDGKISAYPFIVDLAVGILGGAALIGVARLSKRWSEPPPADAAGGRSP